MIKHGKYYSKLYAQLGIRSKLELKVKEQLVDNNIIHGYESEVIKFTPEPKVRRYTPDFILTKKNGDKMYIEVKGYFKTADRVKHLAIQRQHHTLDIRFLFENSNNKLNKKSKTTYAAWCDKHGFRWASKIVPEDWLNE